MTEELNSNTVNFIEDAEQILKKNESQLSLIDYLGALVNNYHFISESFNIDEKALRFEAKITETLNLCNE